MSRIKARLAGTGGSHAKSRNTETRHAPCPQQIDDKGRAAACTPADCVIEAGCGMTAAALRCLASGVHAAAETDMYSGRVNDFMVEQGIVVKRFGSEALFEDRQHRVHRAKVRRKLGHLVVGDRIRYRSSGGEFVIDAILPRANLLTRQYFRGRARNIAANIDQILIITAPAPRTDWPMVDNLLVTVRLMPADAILVRNKSDLEDTPDNKKILREYETLGYPVIATSAERPETLTPLRARLNERTSIMIGQSGVGKTTLTNLLIPDLDAPTQAVSENTELGQHTTSAATLYHLPEGGQIIDSPGIRDFTPVPLEKHEYQYGFVEFEPWLGQCRFHNCLHHQEPGCAIKQAVEDGKISKRRYQSYLSLIDADN